MSRSCHRATFSKPACAFAAHHARQAADLLAGHRVPLVRHGGGALLLLAEKFFRLADFGALQVADLGGDLVECRRNHRQRSQVCACRSRWITCEEMSAAFNPSRAQIFSSSSGVRCANVPTAPENFPTRMSSAAALKARDVALRLRIPVGHLETERDRLGVDSVRAADHGRVFEFPGAPLQHFGEALADPRR